MSYSIIGICNLALAQVGSDSIRSLEEGNKRSRLCGIFYPSVRDFLLDAFDWPFARKLGEVSAAPSGTVTPSGWFAYSLPADCRRVRNLYPPGSRDPWEVIGNYFHCAKSSDTEDVYVYYTANGVAVGYYSESFSQLLALGMALRLVMPLTHDRDLYKTLREEYRFMKADIWETEANTGNSYRAYNENPDKDTFVNIDTQVGFDFPNPWET